MGQDDFDLFEDFDFKPLSEGLGFNQPKQRITNKKKAPLKKVETRSTISRKSKLPEVNLSDLGPSSRVLKPRKNFKLNEKITEKINEVEVTGVRFVRKVLSWFFDTIIILGTTLLFITSIHSILNGQLKLVESLEIHKYFEVGLFFFFMFYIFYFSIFWKTTKQTLGMSLTSLKLESTFNEEMSYTQTLSRAVLSIFNALSLGTMDILGIPSNLTWTKLKNC